MAVFEDKGIDNITAEDASPSPELTLKVVKLLINHRAVATIAFHKSLLVLSTWDPPGMDSQSVAIERHPLLRLPRMLATQPFQAKSRSRV
jgi:hypothetical protein